MNTAGRFHIKFDDETGIPVSTKFNVPENVTLEEAERFTEQLINNTAKIEFSAKDGQCDSYWGTRTTYNEVNLIFKDKEGNKIVSGTIEHDPCDIKTLLIGAGMQGANITKFWLQLSYVTRTGETTINIMIREIEA